MIRDDKFLICKALCMWVLIVLLGTMSTAAFNSLLISMAIVGTGVALWCMNRKCTFYCKLGTI